MSLLLLLACDATLTVKLEGFEEESEGSTDPGDPADPGDPSDPADPVEEEVEIPPEASCVAVERMSYAYTGQGWQQQRYFYKNRHTYDELGRETMLEQNYDRRPGYETAQWTTFDPYGNVLVYGYSSAQYVYESRYFYLYDDEGRLVEASMDADNNGFNESVTLYLYSDSGYARKVVTTYDDGTYQYQSALDELLDEEGRVIQQESDYDFDGRVDYRISHLYAGDLLLSSTTESWYRGQQGQQQSYSQVVDYEYDRNGFLVREAWDYGMDGDDMVTTYANDLAGNPVEVVYYSPQRAGGPLVAYTTTLNSYDMSGRIDTSITTDTAGSYMQRSKWKWRCPG